MYDVIW
jgi:hypothetical protein